MTQDNVDEVDSVFRLVENEGIGRLCIYHLVYSGRGSYLAGIDLEAEQKRELMNKILDRSNVERRGTQDRSDDGRQSRRRAFIYYWLLDRDPARATRRSR